VLEQIQPWADRIVAIGMGGAELGNPPSKFKEFFRACRDAGFPITIHAGEEGPAAYVREAVEVLGVDRIDHGIACVDDADLVRTLAAAHVPLTVCPLSNLQLKVVPSLEQHPLRRMLQAGLHVTVNSDDPAYFGGYVTENLVAAQRALRLTVDELVTLVRNGFQAAFMPEADKAAALNRLDTYVGQT
jgi:adenosine deaminase